jgi:ribonuclease BN (tRNA processing enzyme)
MQLVSLPDNKPLSLRNDGGLEAFFIGVGSLFSTEHFHTNFLLVKGEDHLLVDFGSTGPNALRRVARLEPADIRVMMPSHSHDDHIGGLGFLALTSRYIAVPFMQRPKLRLIVTEEYERVLWERSLRGNLEWNEVDSTGKPLTLADYVEVVHPTPAGNGDLARWTVDVGSIHVEIFRTRHIPQQATTVDEAKLSYGFFVDDRVFFSCDSQFDPALVQHYADKGAEWFFHDVQFFPGAVHAPLADLKTLPASIRERMWLVHYADNWRDQEIEGFAGWARQGMRYIFD